VGLRGFNDASRSGRYTFSGPDYCERANEETVLMVQIEDVAGVQNAEAILDVPGVDLVFIGPYDLSQSAGKTGQVDDPELQGMMREVADACVARQRPLGIYADTPEGVRRWMAAGARLFTTGTDSVIFREGCLRLLDELRGASGTAPA
jgi:4-hydroxy-2-oxoheptanedioate aldolase